MFPTYDQVISSVSEQMDAIEDQRRGIVSSMKKQLWVLGIGLVLIILMAVVEPSVGLLILFGVLVYAVVMLWRGFRRYQVFRLQYKDHVVRGMSREILRLCELPGETDRYRYSCDYNHEARIQDQDIQDSRLFHFKIDEIYGEDLFAGMMGLTEFQFSEITLIQVQRQTNSKGHTTQSKVTMFDGILFIADFHKDFEGVTLLKSTHLFNTGVVAGWLQPLKRLLTFAAKEKKVNIDLENEDFNRAFAVQTTDEIKARYILSSSLMERLLAFKQKHPEKLEISFVASKMYVALSSGRNYFEPRLFRGDFKEQLRVVYDDLIFFFGMVEEFDLNTRIWSKV